MKFFNRSSAFKLIIACIFFVGLVMLVSGLYDFSTYDYSYSVIEQADRIEKNGQLFLEAEPFNYNRIGAIKKNDTITMHLTLPDIDYKDKTLFFYSIHTSVYVYADGELIYEYGLDLAKNGDIAPKYYNIVPIPAKYDNADIRVVLRGTKSRSFTGLSKIYLASRSSIFHVSLTMHAIFIIAGIFMISFGTTLILISPYLFIYHNRDIRLFFSGLFSQIIGIYILSYYGIWNYLSTNYYVNTRLEYMSLFLIPGAILGYLSAIKTGFYKRLCIWMGILDTALVVAIAILDSVNVIDLTRMTHVSHYMAILEGPFMIVLSIIDMNKQKKKSISPINRLSDNFYLTGIIVFMLCSIIDIVFYNIKKYGSNGTSYIDIYFMTFGSLVFIICLLLNYFYYNIENRNQEFMKDRLTGIAYTDPLTGLANRARCDMVMDHLADGTGPEFTDYLIISMDLDGLKKVNDTLGHSEGDRLLTGFSTILSECFYDADLIGRMGGDEFMILYTHATENAIRNLSAFRSSLKDWNRKEQNFKYSASYGYSYSNEVPSHSANEVYMLADTRMYEMKKERHMKDTNA